jgi:BirA family biotin operon repressor/biotin-[acetyl-CoA-carboxylase] ligase
VGGEPAQLRSSYLSLCATIGRQVRVELPGEPALVGEAVDVDTDGRLVLRTGPQDAAVERRVGAGDVVHVRPEG